MSRKRIEKIWRMTMGKDYFMFTLIMAGMHLVDV